jgi:hypothetical protein
MECPSQSRHRGDEPPGVTLDADHREIRTRPTASILATMRGYGSGALRPLGLTDTAESTRWARDDLTVPRLTTSEHNQPWGYHRLDATIERTETSSGLRCAKCYSHYASDDK